MSRVPGSISWRATQPSPLPLTFTILNNLEDNMVSTQDGWFSYLQLTSCGLRKWRSKHKCLCVDRKEHTLLNLLRSEFTCPLRCPNTPFLTMHNLLKKKKIGKHSQSPTLLPESCQGLPLSCRQCHQNSYIRPRSPLPTTVKCLCNIFLNSFQYCDIITWKLEVLLKFNDNYTYFISRLHHRGKTYLILSLASEVHIQIISVPISQAVYTHIDLS